MTLFLRDKDGRTIVDCEYYMENEIKRSLKICRDCNQFFHRQTTNKGEVVNSEYKCGFDFYAGTQETEYGEVEWTGEYLQLKQYRHYILSDKCPYKMEHTILGQRQTRNKKVCASCNCLSTWSIFGQHYCLWSTYDADLVKDCIKMSRDMDINDSMEAISSFKCGFHGDRTEEYENEVPKECPLMMEQMVLEDEEIK